MNHDEAVKLLRDKVGDVSGHSFNKKDEQHVKVRYLYKICLNKLRKTEYHWSDKTNECFYIRNGENKSICLTNIRLGPGQAHRTEIRKAFPHIQYEGMSWSILLPTASVKDMVYLIELACTVDKQLVELICKADFTKVLEKHSRRKEKFSQTFTKAEQLKILETAFLFKLMSKTDEFLDLSTSGSQYVIKKLISATGSRVRFNNNFPYLQTIMGERVDDIDPSGSRLASELGSLLKAAWRYLGDSKIDLVRRFYILHDKNSSTLTTGLIDTNEEVRKAASLKLRKTNEAS